MATREFIINQFEADLSVRHIGSIVKRSYSTVHDIIKRFKIRKTLENKTKQVANIFNISRREIKKTPKLTAQVNSGIKHPIWKVSDPKNGTNNTKETQFKW